jgi:hypothetical protein
VLRRFISPDIGNLRNYIVNVSFPPSTNEMMNISLGPNDIGIIKLDQLIDLPKVVPTVLKNPSDVQVGQPIACLGILNH